MPQESRRRNTIIVIILILIVLLVLLLLARCQPSESAVPDNPPDAEPALPASTPEPSVPFVATPPASEKEDALTPAVLQVPAQVEAGASFSLTWTGPNNARDFISIAQPDAAEGAYVSYRDTREGSPLELTAPTEPGDWEVRYVAGRARQILGRVPLAVMPVKATLYAAPEVIMGSQVSVAWTGPDNSGDYITIVPRDAPDGKYGNYTVTTEGSPLMVRAPTEAGAAELRYMTGQGGRVIGRRPIAVVTPKVSLSAPASAIAGSTIEVTWTGPDNPSDNITLVERDRPDGQYGNYANTSNGSPLSLLVPVLTGAAELRYMTGQGAKVLARRPITLLPVEATLSAPAEVGSGTQISVTWTGPNYASDYITIVPAGSPEGEYRAYANTSAGSPLTLTAPNTSGEYEIRYVASQGAKVIARRSIRVTP